MEKLNVFIKQYNFDLIKNIRQLDRDDDIVCIWLNGEQITEEEKKKLRSRGLQIQNNPKVCDYIFCYLYEKNEDVPCLKYEPSSIWQYLVEYSLENHVDFICIDPEKHRNNKISYIIESEKPGNYPIGFVDIVCYEKFEQFKQYYNDYKKIFEKYQYILDNPKRFIRTHFKYQNAPIYIDKLDNEKTCWYLDMFHKDHFEVFNIASRKHKGEWDIEKNKMRANSANPSKRLPDFF